jgi:hypothetical protein
MDKEEALVIQKVPGSKYTIDKKKDKRRKLKMRTRRKRKTER